MDDFEKAILFSFDQSGGVDAGVRAQAAAYLEQVQASPDCWQLCLARFEASQFVEVRFWCAQALSQLARRSYRQLAPPAQAALKQGLIRLGSAPGSAALPGFLINKVAQAVVAIAAHEYPDAWPSFFQDLLGTLGQGPAAVDLVCRILVSVDQDIISLDVPRSAEEAKQSMHFKDSMRERALADIADAWCRVVATYHASSPDTAASVLETVQRYVHWIDIGLVANDTFVPLLFTVLDAPQEHLKGAAADVLTEIVSKRMEATPKLALIQRLGVVPVCARWQAGLPASEDEPELAAKYARLLAALATEVLESWKKVENSVLSMAAVGLAVDAEASADASSACAGAAALLDALFPAVLAVLRSESDEVAAAVVPFLLAYVARLKAVQKRAPGGTLPPAAAAHLPAIFESLAACARFPDASSAYEVAAASATEKVAAEEEESAMADRRQDLFTLFRNTTSLARSDSYSFVGRRLAAALSVQPQAQAQAQQQQGGAGGKAAAAPWQDVEVAVSLLYQLGETAPEADMKPGSGVLAQLAAGVMQADVVSAKHRLVALALLETYVRYSRVLAAGGGGALAAVVPRFLGDRGMGHPCEAVSRRAAYLFCRLAKQLRSTLRPLLPDILQLIHPHLSAIAATPVQEAATSKSTGVLGGRGTQGTGCLSTVDDRLYGFEAVGLLLGQEELPAAQQHAWLAALLQPLVAQMESNTAAAAAAAAGGGSGSGGGAYTPALLVQQALEAVTRVAKGFSLKLCTEARPELGSLLLGALQAAVAAPRALPANKALRARFISLLHRMVECLGVALLPCLPPALEVLLYAEADAADVADVLLLLNQLMIRFKEGLAPVMGDMTPACVMRVHTLLSADWDWSGAKASPAALAAPTAAAAAAAARGSEAAAGGAAEIARPAAVGGVEDVRERGELQRAYYAFLHSLVHNGLASVLLRAPPGSLDAALGALMQGAATHVDAGVRKMCVQTVERLAGDWCGSDGSEALPGFREFVMKRFGGEVLLEGLVSGGGVDIRDAAAISLLTEVAQSLQLVHQRCGEQYLAYLCHELLPRLGWPPEAAQQLVAHISASETRVIKDFLKSALQQIKQQQQQQQQAAAAAVAAAAAGGG